MSELEQQIANIMKEELSAHATMVPGNPIGMIVTTTINGIPLATHRIAAVIRAALSQPITGDIDPTMDDVRCAQNILTVLGYSCAESMEPSADRRRTYIAAMIRHHWDAIAQRANEASK